MENKTLQLNNLTDGLHFLSLGGIGEMVKNNTNGYLFQTNTSEKRIANYVIKTFKNKKKYISFVKKTHNFYLKKLKWTELGKKFFSQIS